MQKDVDFKNPVINIFFKDGSKVKEKDIPKDPLHSSGKFIRYWEDDGSLIVIPTEQIDYFACFEQS